MLKLELCVKFFMTLPSTTTTNIDGHPPQPNDANHSQLPRQYNNACSDNARITTKDAATSMKTGMGCCAHLQEGLFLFYFCFSILM